MGVSLRGAMLLGPGERRQALVEQMWYFCNPQHIITLHPFTITNVNCTPALANVGSRPCVSLAGAGAATDGSNFCYGQASIIPVAGKQTRLHFGVRCADGTNHSWAFGLATVSTTMVANLDSGGTPSANFFVLHKTLTETTVRVRSRKASGTATTNATSLTSFASATWYDFDVILIPSTSTAGAGKVTVFCSVAGASPTIIYDATLSTSIPDTVVTAPCFGFLEGDTGTDATVVSHFGYSQEY